MEFTDSWTAERSEFVADVLRRKGRIRLRVHGESMLPGVWPGETVEIEPCPVAQLRRGDVVLAFRDGRLFLHRFLRHLEQGGFVLRGDSMVKQDLPYVRDAFLGRMVSSPATFPVLTTWLQAYCRAAGFVLARVGIVRRIAMRVHSWRTSDAEAQETLAPVPRGDA